MRQLREGVGYLEYRAESSSKTVQAHEEKYRRISQILDANPEILRAVDGDLGKLSRPNRRGRKARYSSEMLLRSLIVHLLLGGSLRNTEIQLTQNEFLRGFIRIGHRPEAPSYSLLDRAWKAIRPETWERVNAVLTGYATAQAALAPAEIRVDTTAIETNVHYPTDSSLLWDSFRTLFRLFEEAREGVPGLIANRFHERKVKKDHLVITRYAASPCRKRQRKVQKAKVRLIEHVGRIAGVAAEFVTAFRESADETLQAIALEMASYLPSVRQVLDVARRLWIRGEAVPAAERIYSLFEPHTELIKRGRRQKPVEFGHMIWLGQTRSRFITQYGVMAPRIPDSRLGERIVAAHERTFGAPPKVLVADKGFRANPEGMAALRAKVEVVAIPQRLKDFADDAFVALQHFRAGIEGTISTLKRAFGLLRCPYRGFKSFAAHVGLSVFCHNLVVLATAGP